MRTVEKQHKNIRTATACYSHRVMEAIRTSGCIPEDQETMIRIINQRYYKDSLRLYNDADTAVRENLQDIIEATIYGRTQEQIEELEKRYQTALAQIGADRLLTLPEPIKNVLLNTTDFKAKTELLEAIAELVAMK